MAVSLDGTSWERPTIDLTNQLIIARLSRNFCVLLVHFLNFSFQVNILLSLLVFIRNGIGRSGIGWKRRPVRNCAAGWNWNDLGFNARFVLDLFYWVTGSGFYWHELILLPMIWTHWMSREQMSETKLRRTKSTTKWKSQSSCPPPFHVIGKIQSKCKTFFGRSKSLKSSILFWLHSPPSIYCSLFFHICGSAKIK